MAMTQKDSLLTKQDALLVAVTGVAQKLLTHKSTQSFDETVKDCLSILGKALGKNRVFIWKDVIDDTGRICCIQMYEWVDGIYSIQGDEDFENVPYDDLPSLQAALSKEQCLNQRVSLLTDTERSILEPQSIEVLLIAPIVIDGTRWGFIGVDNCETTELFSEHEENMMLTSGFMLASAILKQDTERHLRQSEELVQSMFDATPLSCSVWNDKLELIDCNAGAIKLFNMPSKQNFLKRYADLSPDFQPDGRRSTPTSMALLAKAMKTGRCEFEWMHQKLNGEFIPSHVTLVRIKYKNSNAVAAYVRDLRDLKSEEEQLQELSDRSQLILNAMPLCCNFWDKNFVNIACNDEAVRLFELDNQQEYLDNFFSLSPEKQPCGGVSSEMAQKMITKAFSEGYARFEWMHCRLDGTLIPAEVTLSRLMFKNDYFVVGYTRDLREQKAMLAEVNAAQRKLAQARDEALAHSKAKSEFLANMSHEIRTPMNGIIGLSYLALQSPDINPQMRTYITKIDDSAKALLRIINDILDFSKISAGKLDLENCAFDLMEVLEQATQPLIPVITDKGLEILFDFHESIPTQLVGDAVRLRQVILNLLTNATKFTHQGTIVIHIEIEAHTASDVTLRFTVADTGVGIAQEYAAQLFDAFSQADSSVTRRYGGTGLGLAICKQIITLMGGEISVTSTVGEGSAFTFTTHFGISLPDTPECFLSSLSGKRVLVAGGSKAFRTIIKKYLMDLNAIVECDPDGQTVPTICMERQLEGTPCHAVVLDWSIFPMRVAEIASTLRKHSPKDAPLIIATAYNPSWIGVNLCEAGVDVVLAKPVSPMSLHNAFIQAAQSRKHVLTISNDADDRAETDSHTGLEMNPPLPLLGKRVLVAEDNEINRIIAVELLSSFGLEVSVATTGREAIQYAIASHFDVILMDIQMPEIDGIEATLQLRRDHPNMHNTPIIAMTAHAMSGDQEKSLNAGMQAHITKPINPEILYTTLVQWIKK